MPRGAVGEFWQQGDEEDDAFRVGGSDNEPVDHGSARGHRLELPGERFSHLVPAANFLYPEADEVRGTGELDDGEGVTDCWTSVPTPNSTAITELEVLVVPDRPMLVLRVHGVGRSRAWLRRLAAQTRRMFDLDADPLRIAEELGGSAVVGPLIARRPGLRVVGAWDRFELAVRAVLGQQISVRAAATLTRRLVQSYGRPVGGDATVTTHLFPAPAVLADADLRSIGATGAQENTIKAIAMAVAGDDLCLDASQGVEEFVERFCRLPGVGPWTAQYVAMRALGEPDAFPASDLGLRRAAAPRKPVVGDGSREPGRTVAALAQLRGDVSVDEAGDRARGR